MILDPAKLRKLRDLLNPVRDRYGFNYTMARWAELVLGDDLHPANANRLVEPIENEAELVAHILGAPCEDLTPVEDEPTLRRGARRVDLERYAALLLAVVFHEYTRRKPTRITRSDVMPTDRANTFDRDKTSPFYQFATACFEAIGLKVSEDAFREATERWNDPINKRATRQLLWGRLPRANREAPDMVWDEKRLHRRRNLPPDNPTESGKRK
jgi:hypothetical protein